MVHEYGDRCGKFRKKATDSHCILERSGGNLRAMIRDEGLPQYAYRVLPKNFI